ncbi:DUF1206 domain-containing protein [Marinobacter sp. F4218]|nr:DUF1206 domain-containing protein [Marinobacter sp. F4218]
MERLTNEAGDIAEVFDTLRSQQFGTWLIGSVAIGLVAFGIYSLLEAIYRRVAPPSCGVSFPGALPSPGSPRFISSMPPCMSRDLSRGSPCWATPAAKAAKAASSGFSRISSRKLSRENDVPRLLPRFLFDAEGGLAIRQKNTSSRSTQLAPTTVMAAGCPSTGARARRAA